MLKICATIIIVLQVSLGNSGPVMKELAKVAAEQTNQKDAKHSARGKKKDKEEVTNLSHFACFLLCPLV